MAQVTVKKRTDFTLIDNSIFRNKEISAQATGVYCFMMSLPPNWDYSIAGLTKCFPHGKHAIRKCIQELEAAGYLVRRQKKSGGRFGDMEYILYETPQLLNQCEINENVEKNESLPMSKNQTAENQMTELSISEIKTSEFWPADSSAAVDQTQSNTKQIKYLNNQSLKEVNRGSSGDQLIDLAYCTSMYKKAKSAISNLQVPIEVSDLFNTAMKKLLKESHLFRESGVKSDPENVAELLDNLNDKELDSTMIQVLSGYMLSLESEKVIHRPDKLMMMIIYNALIQNQQVALMEKHIYASI